MLVFFLDIRWWSGTCSILSRGLPIECIARGMDPCDWSLFPGRSTVMGVLSSRKTSHEHRAGTSGSTNMSRSTPKDICFGSYLSCVVSFTAGSCRVWWFYSSKFSKLFASSMTISDKLLQSNGKWVPQRWVEGKWNKGLHSMLWIALPFAIHKLVYSLPF